MEHGRGLPDDIQREDFFLVDIDDGILRLPSPPGTPVDVEVRDPVTDDDVVVYVSKKGKTYIFDGEQVTEMEGSPICRDNHFGCRDDRSWDNLEDAGTTTTEPPAESDFNEASTTTSDTPTTNFLEQPAPEFEETSTTTGATFSSEMVPLRPEVLEHLRRMRAMGYFPGSRLGRFSIGVPIVYPFVPQRLVAQTGDHDVDGGYYVEGSESTDRAIPPKIPGTLPNLFLMRQRTPDLSDFIL